MKKFLVVLLMLGFLFASNSAFACGIPAREKVEDCVKNPIQCTKVVVVNTAKTAYAIGNKVVRGAWGLTIGQVWK